MIILVNLERVVGEKLLREASQNLMKMKKVKLSYLKGKYLLDTISWKSCGEKGGGEFSYKNLEREPHLDLEDETDCMKSMRKNE